MFLVGVVTVCSISTAAAQAPRDEAPQWRRTAQGWERCEHWPTRDDAEVSASPAPRLLHPAPFALLIAIIAISALLLPAPQPPARSQSPPRPRHRRRHGDRRPAPAVH